MSEPLPPGGVSAEKQALLAVRKLKKRVEELERAAREPLAIIGAGCRLPGGVESPDQFWALLEHGVDAVSEVPPDRWDVEAFYDPDPDAPGKMYTRRAGFLSNVDSFDARHFGITPREAITMDPQQRLLLEVTWEALERAGQAPDRLSGSDTGVYVGISTNDYGQILLKASDQIEPGMYFGTGNLLNAAAGRLSYVLGLQGPSMAVDTACSSSLVAIHLACQALRNRECRMALAGGVNLVLVPEVSINCCRAKMLAPDGRCKTFDAGADGYVRAEGCAVIVLKRLSDAVADGDRILAVIRGTAVNQDGRSGGFTAPNELAQKAVIRAALANAGVSPSDIDYVEAHGTGTSLGDPIEMHAIVAALREGGVSRAPLVVGSVKTNVGHLEAAAGVTGLLKVALALEHRAIPPHLHFQTLNPHIDLAGAAIEIPRAARPWPRGGRPRFGAVSSFGFTGTNAHAILEEAPVVPERTHTDDRPVHVVPLSARTSAALRELAGRYAERLAGSDEPVGDVAATAAGGRAAFEHRLAVVASTATEASDRLAAAAAGSFGQVHAARARTRDEGAVFLFTGQGSQYAGMGGELYASQPVFKAAIDRCGALLDGDLDRPLLSVLFPADGDSSPIDETAFTQPALFAIEYALAELWKSWGVQPSAVLGHSVGEYVAACVAGALGLEDALGLVAARARLMQALPRGGAMFAVMADEARVRAAIARTAGRLSIAALNGPSNTVVAGDADAVAAVVEALGRDGVSARPLPVSHAFHSPLVEPVLDEFERLASAVAYAPLEVPLGSNLTGNVLERGFLFDGPYWRRHAREAVRFADGITALRARGERLFLEVGPTPTLTAMAQRVVEDEEVGWVASLRKGRGDWHQIVDAVAALFVRGVPIDWTAFDAPYARRRVDLPTYPFQRERCWVQVAPPKPVKPARATADESALYAVEWITARPAPARDAERGAYLVIGGDAGFAAAISSEFRRFGDTCITVPLPADEDEGYRRALAAAGPDTRGVVLIAPSTGVTTVDSVGAVRDCVALSALGRALGSGAAPRARIFVVTQGAQPVGEVSPLRPAGAAAWGFARVFAVEHPELWGGIIDASIDAAHSEAALVAAAVRAWDEDQVAVRGGQLHVPRLLEIRDVQPARLDLPQDATYIITGGLGSLGLAVAERLVQRGARHVALVSRRRLPPRDEWGSSDGTTAQTVACVRKLEAAGATVHLCTADVGDRPAVEALLAALSVSAPPVRGIVHAAGVSTAAPALEVDRDQLEAALRAKVDGAWNLHETTRDLALDFFVAFSSISAVWGSRALAAYASGNAFLDALAHHRRALGLHGVSIDYGPWADGGMTDAESRRWLSSMGMEALEPSCALDAFETVLLSRRAQVVVAAVDWERFLPVFEARRRRPFMDRMRPTMQAATESADSGEVERLSRLVPTDRRDAIVQAVRDQVAAVTGWANSAAIGVDEGLFEMGLDSLMATQLRRRLERQFGRAMSPTLTFDYPSVGALAAYIDAECFGEATPAAVSLPVGAAPGGGLEDAIAALEALSDDRVDEMLSEQGRR